tara:strand:+ start:1425 stop:2330 length:906 start_codon:yes stop_codon:yes gene_type:complete
MQDQIRLPDKRRLSILFLATFFPICGLGDEQAIHRLIINGDEALVIQQLEESPELVSQMGENSMLPIHYAVSYSSLRVIRVLIHQGSDVNAKCYNGFTPLHLCVQEEAARFLIEKGADATLVDSLGSNPLQRAVFDGRTSIANALLESGIPMDLLSAIALGKVQDARQLAIEDPIKVKDENYFGPVLPSALMAAARFGSLELSELFVKLGANPNQYRPFEMGFGGGCSPLTEAALGLHHDVAKFLIDNGANPFVKVGIYGNSLLSLVPKSDEGREIRDLLSSEWEGLSTEQKVLTEKKFVW